MIVGAVAYYFVVRAHLTGSAKALETEIAKRADAVVTAIKGK